MNKKNIITLSLALALTAGLAHATSKDFAPQQAASISMPQVDTIEKEATTYIWPQVHAAQANFIEKQARSSNEYWQVITGAELSKGVAVHTTSDALIRLAAFASSEPSAHLADALNPALLSMSTAGNKLVNAERIMSQTQMEQAGFADGSVALKVAETEGKLTLKTRQNLADNAKYLLHVKEKNSPVLLSMSANSNVAGLSNNSMKLDLVLADSQVLNSEAKVRLLTPQGQEVNVKFANSQLTFIDDLAHFGARDGLYELEVNVEKQVDGKLVKRTVKFPFANTVKTAELAGKPQLTADAGYLLPVTVYEPGRYNITATLQGETVNGNLVRLQTVSSAAWLESNGQLSLPFTLKAFKHYKNLALVDIKLMDQSRLMVQQVIESDSSL